MKILVGFLLFVVYSSTGERTRRSEMEVEQMKRQLRELIYRRDMLCYERDSLELDDLIRELNEEIEELREELKNIA